MTPTASLPPTESDASADLIEGLSWQDFGLAGSLVGAVADGETVGPGMYAFLTEIDPASLAPGARVDLIRALERAAAMISGLQQYALASVVDATTASGLEGDDARHEVGAALRLSPGTAADRTRVAAVLRDRLRGTMAALAAGDINYLQAVAVADAVRDLPDDLAAALETRVLPRISHQTAAETRRTCRAAVEALDPEGSADRHRKAVKGRTLERMALRDAMESTWFSLPAGMSADFWSVLSADARAQKAARRDLGLADPGIDALRVDALVDAVLHNGGVDPDFPRVVLTGGTAPRPGSESADPPAPTQAKPADFAEHDDARSTVPVPCPARDRDDSTTDTSHQAAAAPTSSEPPTSATDVPSPSAPPNAATDATTSSEPPTSPADAPSPSTPPTSADPSSSAHPSIHVGVPQESSRPVDPTPRVPRCSCGGRQTAAVVIDLPTLLGLATNPGELTGYGAVPAEVARAMATDRDWVRWTVDPGTRQVIDRGAHSYRPSAAMLAFIAARDRVCGFPGCSQPAQRCDCDHITTFDHDAGPAGTGADNGDGGNVDGRTVDVRTVDVSGTGDCSPTGTVTGNLGPLCRQHHNAKTHGRWQLAYDPDAMVKTWISPLGKRYDVGTDPPLL